MSERWIIRIDYRNPDKAIEIRPVTSQVLENAVRSIAESKSATISLEELSNTTDDGIEEAPPLLIISCSSGRYMLTAWLENGFMYDFVGQPEATGKTSLVLGGQLTDYPNRYTTNLEQALKIANEFYRNGSVDLSQNSWDEQNNSNSVWR
jgi:hypothetical protein